MVHWIAAESSTKKNGISQHFLVLFFDKNPEKFIISFWVYHSGLCPKPYHFYYTYYTNT